ncbi:MAG: hypothetical protein E3J69_07390 [Anaerolineales bacterium]|nr:MAG: hypothetical protein E3J69_07390 [Anaerolineales bacterium]
MTDQPLTDVGPIESADEEIDYSIPQKIEIAPDGIPMKPVYKFFQLAILNAKEELQFNKDFESWTVAGVATYGARIVVLGMKFMPVVEVVEEEVVEEEADPGMLDDEIEVKEASNTPPAERIKVVDPFRK